MLVISGNRLYDVSSPIHPRLVCTANTEIQLVDARTVAYTDTQAGGKTTVMWHDVVTGLNKQVGLLPHLPEGIKNWTADGKIEVYAGPIKPTNAGGLVPVHLFANGIDRVLLSIPTVDGGYESRWSPYPILEISPGHTYLAISDSRYGIGFSGLHIFSIGDRRQLLAPAGGNGGTWLADDRFVWPSDATGALVQWTPQGGVTSFRPDKWSLYGLTHSPDRQWLAGTVESSGGEPDVLIFPASGGVAVKRPLASDPVFVSPTVVWYAGEKACADSDPCGADSTTGDGTVHAYDVITHTDTVLKFRAGEDPGGCCTVEY